MDDTVKMFKNYGALSALMLCHLERWTIHQKCLQTMAPKGPKCCAVLKDGRYSKKCSKPRLLVA